MSEQKKNFGRPWEKDSKFFSYEDADKKRNEIISRKDNKYDVKVKRFSVDTNTWVYYVKTRLKEEFIEKKNESKRKKKLSNKSKKSKNKKDTQL